MTKPKPLPPVAELRAIFVYDPATGKLFRTKKDKSLVLCASKCSQGYCRVKYKSTYYKASRLIWTIETGRDPGYMTIDHINRVRDDNRWCNLRLADHSMQKLNRGILKTSSTGLKGAFASGKPWGKPYRSAIMQNGVRISLGSFDTIEAAHQAYIDAGGIP
jgi:hypothetical protein